MTESRLRETRYCNEVVYRKVAYGPKDDFARTQCGALISMEPRAAKACTDCGRLEGTDHEMRMHIDDRKISYDDVKIPGPVCAAGHQLGFL